MTPPSSRRPAWKLGRLAAQGAERTADRRGTPGCDTGEEFDNVSPATGLVLGSTAAAGTDDMSGAIGAARRAFDEPTGPPTVRSASVASSNCRRPSRPNAIDLREELIAEVGCPE